MKLNARILMLATAVVIAGSSMAHAQVVQQQLVFDNVSNFRNGVAGATGTATGSTPNTFMGAGYNLASSPTSITGFDIYPVNLSGTGFTGLRINIFVWGNVNTGTVNATTPAFSNLLGSYTLTTGTGTYSTGSYFPFEGTTPGVTPGVTLGTPLALTSSTVGITFNYQGTTNGTTYSSINSLTSLITYGTAPTVGTNVFNGYYRNAASETNGNFTSTLRSLGTTDQGLGLRIYGNVIIPETATWVMLLSGLTPMGLILYRRNSRRA